jgi:hypothetical protein
MIRIVACIAILVQFLFSVPPVFSKNFSNQILMYCLKGENIKEIRDHFRTSEKICAEFTFLPEEKETGVQFRWYNPKNKRARVDFELVKSPMPPEKRTVAFWFILQSGLMDNIIGSRYSGTWRVEIWVNNRRITAKEFTVGN